MTDTYTIEQIEQIEAAIKNQTESIAGFSVKVDWTKVIAELTKPGWKLNDGQVYINDEGGVYKYSGCHDTIGLNIRPLTTKEAGPQCMQHLVDALKEIALMK